MENPIENQPLTTGEIVEKIIKEQEISAEVITFLKNLKNETTKEHKPLLQFITALRAACKESGKDFNSYLNDILEKTL